jgi:hypothetical protein
MNTQAHIIHPSVSSNSAPIAVWNIGDVVPPPTELVSATHYADHSPIDMRALALKVFCATAGTRDVRVNPKLDGAPMLAEPLLLTSTTHSVELSGLTIQAYARLDVEIIADGSPSSAPGREFRGLRLHILHQSA